MKKTKYIKVIVYGIKVVQTVWNGGLKGMNLFIIKVKLKID